MSNVRLVGTPVVLFAGLILASLPGTGSIGGCRGGSGWCGGGVVGVPPVQLPVVVVTVLLFMDWTF